MPLERLAQRFLKVFPSTRPGCPPTECSLQTIHDRLHFPIPADFVQFASICPAYDSWFASIGEDFENARHILKLNATYHSPDYALLPPELILISHGYDGDLDCYDLSNTDEQHRVSICYLEAIESEFPKVNGSRQHIAFSLAEYLEPHVEFWERTQPSK
jgi:hypothetical protein